MKKCIRFLMLCMVMLTGIIIVKPSQVNAAKANIKVLEINRTYRNLDVTSDGVGDRFEIWCQYNSYNTGYQVVKEYSRCSIWLNGNNVFDFVPNENKACGCDSIKAELITLKNNQKFLYLECTGDDDDGSFMIFQYKNGKLKKIAQLDKFFGGDKYGYHCAIDRLSVSGNTVTAHAYFMNFTTGVSYYDYKYVYKKGTLVKKSDAGDVVFCYKNGKKAKTFTLKRSIKIYKSNTSNKVIKKLPAGKKLTLTKVYYSSKAGMRYRVKFGSRTGWIKCINGSGKQVFKGVQFAG